MARLVLLGLIAAVFFGSTFPFNRYVGTEGGHWAWTGALRWIYVALIIAGLSLLRRDGRIQDAYRVFRTSWLLWIVSGTCVGIAYACMCFAATHMPSWALATLWQGTIVAGPLCLILFGKRVPMRGFLFTLLILAGVLLVQVERLTNGVSWHHLLLFGVLPVGGAMFLWPTGNQLVKEAVNGSHARIPHVMDAAAKDAFVQTLLISVGSIPFWVVVLVATDSGMPRSAQLFGTVGVAICSGAIAMTIFLRARQAAKTPYQLAAVEATQAGEVPSAMIMEWAFLTVVFPGTLGIIGLLALVIGLVLYVKKQPE